MIPAMEEMQKTQVQSLGWEGPLEEEMATDSSVLAWKVPRTGEPGGHSPRGRREPGTTVVTMHTRVQALSTEASFSTQQYIKGIFSL